MKDTFTVEIYEYDDETDLYEWNNYAYTPIFEQAVDIMRHLGEEKIKARMMFYVGDTKHYFWNYDFNKEQIVFLCGEMEHETYDV